MGIYYTEMCFPDAIKKVVHTVKFFYKLSRPNLKNIYIITIKRLYVKSK